jgi:hypothetical protein
MIRWGLRLMVVGSSIAGRLACIAFGAESIIKFLIC